MWWIPVQHFFNSICTNVCHAICLAAASHCMEPILALTVSGLINTERRWGKPFSVRLPDTVSLGLCSICKTCSHKNQNQMLQFLNGILENYWQANKSCVRPCKKPPSFGVWFCFAEIIFTLKFGSVDRDLLQTLVNPLYTLESWSSKFNTALAFCRRQQHVFCVCIYVHTVTCSCVKVCV